MKATNSIVYLLFITFIVQQCAGMVPRAAGEVVGATSLLLYRSTGAPLMHDFDSGRVNVHSLSLSFSVPCPHSPVIGGIVRPSPDQPFQASTFDYMQMKWYLTMYNEAVKYVSYEVCLRYSLCADPNQFQVALCQPKAV